MVRVGVRYAADGDYEVVVENQAQGYKRAFEVFRPRRGMFGVSPADIAEARLNALKDATDWVAKFLGAGIKADLVEVMS